jgi:hypothetical protein
MGRKSETGPLAPLPQGVGVMFRESHHGTPSQRAWWFENAPPSITIALQPLFPVSTPWNRPAQSPEPRLVPCSRGAGAFTLTGTLAPPRGRHSHPMGRFHPQ